MLFRIRRILLYFTLVLVFLVIIIKLGRIISCYKPSVRPRIIAKKTQESPLPDDFQELTQEPLDFFRLLRSKFKEDVSSSASKKSAKDDEPVKDFLENLCFAVFINRPFGEESMEYGLHRLRAETHRVPKIIIYLSHGISPWHSEEISMWSGVQLKTVLFELNIPCTQTALLYDEIKGALMRKVINQAGHVIWVQDGWLFNPASKVFQEALVTTEPGRIKAATGFCRKYLMSIYNSLKDKGHFISEDRNDKQKIIEAYTDSFERGTTKELSMVHGPGESGLVRFVPEGDSLGCFINVRKDAAGNSLFYSHKTVGRTSDKFKSLFKDGKRMAIGMPTTSKGKNFTEPIFFKDGFGTLVETMTEEEAQSFAIDVYIGYDHFDPFFDSKETIERVLSRCQEIIGTSPIRITMVRLPAVNRIGMLWNFLFELAMKEGNHYFYQINDDLRMITKGWITKFTAALDTNHGFGVVGPSDNFVGFGCKLLTQAMVTRRHHEIFGTFYPIELKDWKTDLWLTKVYGSNSTFCWPEYVANNGGSRTRYVNCPGHDWRIYLEWGKRRIKEWQESQ